jgi:hypothetical protein
LKSLKYFLLLLSVSQWKQAGKLALSRVIFGRMHGGHLKSGKQTDAGRKRIADAMRKRMLAFWQAWRDAGRPPLAWRESLRRKKSPRATAFPPRVMDFSGEKSWLVKMHGRRLVVHGREQVEVVLLAS